MNIKSLIKRSVLILIFGPILGVLLLWGVHLLPTDPMRSHLYWAEESLWQDIENEVQVVGYPASLFGAFTDCLMLEHAIYHNPEHSAFSQAMHMYRAESFYDEKDPSAWWPGVSLLDYLNNVPATREVDYSRYWHGYLVVLKPLLLVTSLNALRLFNTAAQLMLLGLVLILLSRRANGKLAFTFVASVPFMYFFGMYFSLSLSICYYLTTFSMLLMLLLQKRLEKEGRFYLFFLVTGMATSYFDFLTYPLVVLGFPLIVYGYMYFKKNRKDFWKIAVLSGFWGVGYAFMWGSKWIIMDVVYREGIIQNALSTIFSRTSGVAQNRILGLIKVVRSNMSPFINWGFVLFALMLVLVLFGIFYRNKKKLNLKNIGYLPVFLTIALMPVAWFFVTENHSAEHWMFTCKILSVTVFAVLAGVVKLFEKNSEK